MSDLLELPAIRKQVELLSVDDYHRIGELGILSEKVELLRGIIVRKMAKSPLHEFVAQSLMMLLLAQVPPAFAVRPERPLTLQSSEPEPDISIVRGQPADWSAMHPTHAELVIEIAITSILVDQEKADIYAQGGIPEYWLVRPEDRVVDVYRQPTPDGYASRNTLSAADTLLAISIPEIQIPIQSILAPEH
jgi:Uma2 family endonuclease